MKLAFATLGCPGWTLERVASEARSMGYDGVELRGVSGEHIGPDETPARRAQIRRMFEDRGVEIAAVMGYTNFTSEDAALWAQAVAGTEAMIKLCGDIGCPMLRVFGGKRSEGMDRERAIERVAGALQRLVRAAERWQVTLAVETHDDWCQGAWLREVLVRVGHPRIGVCWDVANSWFQEPAERTWEALSPWIRHVHFKDAKRDAEGKIRSVLPGEGEVDLTGILRLLRRGGYAGYLSFEWEKKWQPELAEPETAFPHYIRYVRSLLSRPI